MESSLATLRDVEGVFGSFVLARDGSLIVRDMPAMVDEKTLAGVGRRVARIRAALEAGGRRNEQFSIRFGEHLLLCKAADALTLCVLVAGRTNLLALQMGTTLVARRVAQYATQWAEWSAREKTGVHSTRRDESYTGPFALSDMTPSAAFEIPGLTSPQTKVG